MNRIAEVRVLPLTIPIRTPVQTATTTWRSRNLAVVRLIDEDGAEGLGEIASDAPDHAADHTAQNLARVMVGVDITDLAHVRAMVQRIEQRLPPVASAVSAAGTDLRARLAGRRLVDELGSHHAESVALNGIVGADAPEEAARAARALADAGFMCIKVKAGAESAVVTVERVAAIRTAVGGTVGIRLDLNGALDHAAAVRLLGDLEPYGLDYVEDPLEAQAGPHALAALRAAVAVEIAVDEGVTGEAAAERFLQANAVDVLVLKPARVGGLEAAAAIISKATAAGAAVVLSTLFETGVGLAGALHLAATVPRVEVAHGLATAHLLASDLLIEPLPVVGGRMAVPRGPGLGIELDEAALIRFGRA